MSGPSSLMLALMASGLNGQSFAFLGYLPAKTEERRQALRSIEKHSSTARQTKIFIETPYRNDSLLADILSVCRADTEVCIAANITMPDAFMEKVRPYRRQAPLRIPDSGTLTLQQWERQHLT